MTPIHLAKAFAVAWICLASILCFAGALKTTVFGVHAPFVAVYWMPTVVTATAATLSVSIREWLLSLDVRGLMLLHTCRFAGFGTLCLGAYGLTSPLWAYSAGLGDMLAAGGFTYLAYRAARDGQIKRGALVTWNVIGLVDFLHVLVMATLLIPSNIGVLAGDTPATTGELALEWPFAIVPIVVVPWLVVSHFVMFAQARRAQFTIQFS